MRKWALVDKDTNEVREVIAWDGVTTWSPTIPNVDVIECTDEEFAECGGTYVEGVFFPMPVEQQAYSESTITANNEVTTEPTVL